MANAKILKNSPGGGAACALPPASSRPPRAASAAAAAGPKFKVRPTAARPGLSLGPRRRPRSKIQSPARRRAAYNRRAKVQTASSMGVVYYY